MKIQFDPNLDYQKQAIESMIVELPKPMKTVNGN